MSLDFSPPPLPAGLPALRERVRAFIARQRQLGVFQPKSNAWTDVNRAFSEACGREGLIGMTWPRAYGGSERSQLEQFVVVEEMLAAGAPVGGHWLADRQSGPQILKFGTEAARQAILPRIAAGRACFGICMSEPQAGSDLAGVRTSAERVDGGWRIHGRKIWTTNAHHAQYLTVLCRTDPSSRRHAGLSQLIVAMPDAQVSVRPIRNIAGHHEFNEVTFDGCYVPDAMVLGAPGEGWRIVTDELALERSGPDRYMSSLPLLLEWIDVLNASPAMSAASAERGETGDALFRDLGLLLAQTIALRQMSLAVAGAIAQGRKPDVQAALVKELGSLLEQATPEAVRRGLQAHPGLAATPSLDAHLRQVLLDAPSFSLRGGTREILRGIVAKSLAT